MYLGFGSDIHKKWKSFLSQVEGIYQEQHRDDQSLTRVKNARVAELPATSFPIDFIFAQFLSGVLRDFFKKHPELRADFSTHEAAIAREIGMALAALPLKIVSGKDLYTTFDKGELITALMTVPYKAIQRAREVSVPDCSLFEIGQIVKEALCAHLDYTNLPSDDEIFNPNLPLTFGVANTPFEQGLIEKVAQNFDKGELERHPDHHNSRHVLTIDDAWAIVKACRVFFTENPNVRQDLPTFNQLTQQLTAQLLAFPLERPRGALFTLGLAHGFGMDHSSLKSGDYIPVLPADGLRITIPSTMAVFATTTSAAVLETVGPQANTSQLPTATNVV